MKRSRKAKGRGSFGREIAEAVRTRQNVARALPVVEAAGRELATLLHVSPVMGDVLASMFFQSAASIGSGVVIPTPEGPAVLDRQASFAIGASALARLGNELVTAASVKAKKKRGRK